MLHLVVCYSGVLYVRLQKPKNVIRICTGLCLKSTSFVCLTVLQVGMTKKLTASCIMVLEIYSESAQW